VVRASELRVRGGQTVTAGNAVPSAGELAVFCRPVVTAPAVVRRDGSVLRTVEPRAIPAATCGQNHALTPAAPLRKRTQEQTRNTKLEKPVNTTNT
jgi:hypothetical protein